MEGTKVDMKDYKDKLITEQGWVCPITQEYIDNDDVEVLFVNDTDFVVSHEGLKKLRIKYGPVYINSKIVHLMTIDEVQKKVYRDRG